MDVPLRLSVWNMFLGIPKHSCSTAQDFLDPFFFFKKKKSIWALENVIIKYPITYF